MLRRKRRKSERIQGMDKKKAVRKGKKWKEVDEKDKKERK